MTQQNETEQGTAAQATAAQATAAQATAAQATAAQASATAEQSVPQPPAAEQRSVPPQPTPVFPSPYLDGGEAVPEAYPAPPQPGQPRYGTPPYPQGGRQAASRPLGYRQPAGGQPADRPSGNGQPGLGQSPYGQSGYGPSGSGPSGYGPSGYGPSGYGRTGARRPVFGPAAAVRRDPALASPWQRLAATILDWLIIFVVSVIAFWSPLSEVWRAVEAITSRYSNLTSPAAQAAISSLSRDPTTQHALLYWILGMFGIALVYYFVQQAAWGATIGKRVLGVRVVRAADRSPIGVRAAGIRTVAFLVGPAVFVLLFWPVNIVGGVLWAADAVLPLLDPQAQALHDKLAGTVAMRERALNQRARAPSPW